jgi:hypothetical protein
MRVAMFIGPVYKDVMDSWRWPSRRDVIGQIYMRVAPCDMREQARIRREYFTPPAQRTAAELIDYSDRPRSYAPGESPYADAMRRMHYMARRDGGHEEDDE